MRLLANIGAFVATVATALLLLIVFKMEFTSFGLFVMGMFYFGIANGWVQTQMNRPQEAEVSAPVLEDAPQQTNVPTADASESPTPASSSDNKKIISRDAPTSVEPEESVLPMPVGTIVDERLMVKPRELERVHSGKPFGNVIQLTVPAGPMNPGGEQDCFVILSPQSAVYSNPSTGALWSVDRGGVKARRHRISGLLLGYEVTSTDGRHEKLTPAKSNLNDAALLAWCYDSYDEFQAAELTWPNEWALLAREIKLGLSIAGILPWTLPYETKEDGLALLAQQPMETIRQFATSSGVTADDLKKAGVGLESPVCQSVEILGIKKRRRDTILIAVTIGILLGVATWIPYLSNSLGDRPAQVLAGSIVAAVLGITVWAFVRCAKELARVHMLIEHTRSDVSRSNN